MKLSDVKIMSTVETIDLLLNSNKSICRLGDGEFSFLDRTRKKSTEHYQKINYNLSNKLEQILTDKPNDNIIIALSNFVSVKSYEDKINEWNVSQILLKCIEQNNSNYVFGNAGITRNYKLIPTLKLLWENKNVVLVEGEYCRGGVGNDLYDNVASLKRIICPAENAYDKYDAICQSIRTNCKKDDLILCALGPTATCIAYDLSKEGYRILDIGQVDIIYEWYKSGGSRLEIPGKYVNESTNGHNISEIKDCTDKSYLSSIIDKVL
jgi:glycosyltransferase family protein